MLWASRTSTSVGGKSNHFFTLSAQFVESGPCGRVIILFCRTLLPLIPLCLTAMKKSFSGSRKRSKTEMFVFSVSSSHATRAYPSLQVWRLDTFWHFMLGNVPSTNPFCVPEWLLGCLCFSPSVWMAPGLLTRWSSSFTSHTETPANFGHSAQYLSCPHFATKPCWLRNTASVLYLLALVWLWPPEQQRKKTGVVSIGNCQVHLFLWSQGNVVKISDISEHENFNCKHSAKPGSP